MFEISKLKAEDGENAVCLIVGVAEKFLYPHYSEAGREAFRGYVTAASLVADDSENFALVARLQDAIVGVAKVRRKNHLSMLFIAAEWQGRGLGRQLLDAAVDECRTRNPGISNLTANSSKFALPFFRRRGFQVAAVEQQVNGIRFTPVRLELTRLA